MTIGQRIAQKRKELALSQEALGAQLGVSRQAIYKWESDAALPEIDKLIALARLYGVSVGWLLGVEEAPAPESPAEEGPPPGGSARDQGELSEAQLAMVREIVGQYLAAQPRPKRRRWPFVLAAVVLVIAIANLFSELDVLRAQQDSIHNNISRVESSVNHQINGIAGRVEEILKSQNNLTADYSTELVSVDPAQNQATFSVRAVPKTYTVDMWVEFSIDDGEACFYVPGDPSHDEAYTAELTCGLTNAVTISAVFTQPDGTRQTQVLDTYHDLYNATLPAVDDVKDTNLMFHPLNEDRTLTLSQHERYFFLRNTPLAPTIYETEGVSPAEMDTVQVGLFLNQRLIAWAEPCPKPESYHGFEDCAFYCLPEIGVTMGPGDVLTPAAVVTDVYGRQLVQPGMSYIADESDGELTYADGLSLAPSDIASWTF